MSHLYSHERDQARQAFAKLFAEPADSPRALMLAADLMYQEEYANDAEALYQEIRKKWPDFPVLGRHWNCQIVRPVRASRANARPSTPVLYMIPSTTRGLASSGAPPGTWNAQCVCSLATLPGVICFKAE